MSEKIIEVKVETNATEATEEKKPTFREFSFAGLDKAGKEALTPSEKRTVTCSFPSSSEIQFSFKDEKALVFDLSVLTEQINKSARNHGLKQKLSDSLAMSKEMQEITTDAQRRAMLLETWEHIAAGSWNKPSKAGSEGKESVQKKAASLVAQGGLSEVEIALMRKLGLMK
jgi:hypothetical protein